MQLFDEQQFIKSIKLYYHDMNIIVHNFAMNLLCIGSRALANGMSNGAVRCDAMRCGNANAMSLYASVINRKPSSPPPRQEYAGLLADWLACLRISSTTPTSTATTTHSPWSCGCNLHPRSIRARLVNTRCIVLCKCIVVLYVCYYLTCINTTVSHMEPKCVVP